MDDITFVPALSYRDPKAALDWLADAFGFELTMAIDGPDGDATQGHYEMGYEGRGRIMVGAEWNEWMRSPASVDGHTTASVHVDVARDIDAHCERARAAGATIVAEPSDQFYGDRDVPLHRPRGPPLDVRDARARREPRRGRGRDRHADLRHHLAVSARATAAAVDRTLAALADPVRRRSVELLAERPRRAGELAAGRRRVATGHEPAPAGAARRGARRRGAPAVRRARPHHLVAAEADGCVEGVAGRRRDRVERAAGRVQGPRGARVTGSRVLVALRVGAPPARTFDAFTGEIGAVVAARTGCSSSPIASAVASRSSPSHRSGWSRSAPTASGSRSDAVRVWDPPRRVVFGWRQATLRRRTSRPRSPCASTRSTRAPS